MITPIQLHNAAYRYCIDRRAYRSSLSQKLNYEEKASVQSESSDSTLDIFPRCDELNAILNEIERIDTDKLPEYSELLELLMIIGQIAENPKNSFRCLQINPVIDPQILEIQESVIQYERDKFVEAVCGFTSESIANVPALPYQRLLSATDVSLLWKRAEAKWGATGGGFYPLAEGSDSSLRAFNTSAFDQEFPAHRLQSILKSWGIERVYELREFGDQNYLRSIDSWKPYYNGAEGFWFSDALDWIMYASHEDSITIGGLLTDIIVSEWEDIDKHEWGIY